MPTGAATDVSDIVQAAVRFLRQGSANRGFDVHVPGGITGQQIAETATRVLGRDVAYQMADVPARDCVEPFPISWVHKDLYAELFDYFKATTYLGDPQPVTDALPWLRISGVEDFLRGELFAGT
jgi:uncharacterized protein YbjT (DUF2867 family)